MFCPRCGTGNDAGNRFCVSCGSDLAKASAGEPTPSPSLGQRLRNLVGTSRRAQLLSVGTAAAIVVAVVAFIALEPSDGGESSDPYLQQLDRSCVAEKERLSSLEAETLGQRPPNLEEFASVLVTIVAEWRSNLKQTPPPSFDGKGVRVLEAALLKTLIESGTLSRLVREGAGTGAIAAQSSAVDEATKKVNGAIAALDLEECAETEVAPVG